MSSRPKVSPFTVRPFTRAGRPTGQWQLDIPPRFAPGGKRKRMVFENRKAAEAEATRMLREVQLTGRIAGLGPSVSGVTFGELAPKWQEHEASRVRTMKKRSSSLVTQAYQLKSLMQFFGQEDISRINGDRITQYQEHRLKQGRQPSTINSETSCLLHVLRWAIDRGLLDRAPKVENIDVPYRRIDLPTREEVAKVVAALPNDAALFIRFIAETGCRKGEAVNLTWGDIDDQRKIARVCRKAEFTPKTQHSDRDIPITDELAAALRAHRVAQAKKGKKEGEPITMPAKTDLVFPGRGGAVRTDMSKALASAVKAAGVERDGEPMKLKLHMLRKFNISWMDELGVSERVTQARVGHAPGSRVTQRVYVQVKDHQLRAAAVTLPRVPTPRDLATTGNRAKKKGSR